MKLALVSAGRTPCSARLVLLACLAGLACSERKVLFPAESGAAPSCGEVSAVYSNASNWMDYVRNQGGNGALWNRCAGACADTPPYAGTPCTGEEDGYFACLHGGELRFFQVPGVASCAGLAAADVLLAFDWMCDDSTGRVFFISKGLRTGKGLRDLLTTSPALGFAANQVTVTRQGAPLCQTPATVWWSNPITALPDASAHAATLDANTIYVAATTVVSNGYALPGLDKTAIVTLAGATLEYGSDSANWCARDGRYDVSGNGSARPVICAGGTTAAPSRFLWIEARVNPGNPGAGIPGGAGIAFTDAVRMARIHRSEVVGTVGHEASITSQSPLTRSILIKESWASEVLVQGSSYVTIWRSRADGGTGFRFSSPNGLLYEDTASNSALGGFDLVSADRQTAVGLTSLSNAGPAFTLESGGSGANVLMASSGYSNRGAGANMGLRVAGTGDTLVNIALAGTFSNCMNFSGCHDVVSRDLLSAHNACGFQQGNSSGNAFSGTLWFGQNQSGSCENQDGTGNLPSSEDCQPAQGYTAVGGVQLEDSFAGAVSADSANTSQGLGATVPATSITDWHHFENPFRAFGLPSGGALFASSRAGNCATGACQLFDYTLNPSGTMMRGRFGVWSNDGQCPASLDAAASVLTDAAGRVFLAHAVELLDPWFNPNGNNNGLCESDEACLFTPNIGSYQGRGDLAESTACVLAGAKGVSNVRLRAYPIN